MKSVKSNLLVIGVLWSSVYSMASAQSFIFQGINQIADAGAGQANVTDASAATSNPAGLALIPKTGSYADLSLMSVRYTYAHTNYDPVTLQTNAPPLNLGANVRTKYGVNFGLVVAPRSLPGAKAIDVKNVPTFTGAGYAAFDLKVRQTGLLAALGAGGRMQSLPLSLGISVLYGRDGQEITAYPDEGDHVTPGMDMRYEGGSFQGIVGARYELSNSVLAASFRTPGERHYKGDIASAVTDNVYARYQGVSYQPATFAAAYDAHYGKLGGLFEVSREFWSRGRDIANRGLPYASAETDFQDTIGLAMAGRFYDGGERIYSASFGYYSANTRDGSKVNSSATNLADSEIPASTGMEFGQMEAIPRFVFGGGFKQKLSNDSGYWMLSGNYQTGTRVIPVGHKGEGWYHLDVYTLSGGLNTTF